MFLKRATHRVAPTAACILIFSSIISPAYAALNITKSGDLTATKFDELGFDPTGLVGYWQLNGNANDSSGNHNDGTIMGATATTDRFGTAGQALSFDGLSQYVNVGDPASGVLDFGTNDYSISMWFKPNVSDYGDHVLVGKYVPGTAGYTIGLWNSNIIYFHNPTTTNVQTTYTNGVWMQVVATRDVGGKKLYVNGILKDSQGGVVNASTSNSFMIGGSTEQALYSPASVDEVKVFNRALIASEILSMYNHEKGKFSVGKDGVDKSLQFIEDPALPVQARSKKESLTVKGSLIEQ